MPNFSKRFRSVLIVVLIGAMVVAGWKVWRASQPTGTVTARIVLDRGVCSTPLHASECQRLAHGGILVVFGPITNSTPNPETHEIKLRSVHQTVSLGLQPGSYDLGFWIEPPYRVLLPNFGTKSSGNFVVRADTTTDLGIVQPGTDWIVTES
jgi:hypothetical protein